MSRIRLLLATLFLAIPFVGGCSSAGGSVDMAGWKQTVEKYIDVHGNGDPTVLRNVTWPQSRRGFSVIGGDIPAQSQDAEGLLLAVQQIDGRRWFIFIVGIVDKQVVKEMHLAAMSAQDGKRTWKVSGSNSTALHAYRDYYTSLWKSRFPGQKEQPPQYTTFPKESDAFSVQIQGGTVRVTHPESGARWELVIDPKVHSPPPGAANPPVASPPKGV